LAKVALILERFQAKSPNHRILMGEMTSPPNVSSSQDSDGFFRLFAPFQILSSNAALEIPYLRPTARFSWKSGYVLDVTIPRGNFR